MQDETKVEAPQIGVSALTGFLEGSVVRIKPSVLSCYAKQHVSRFANRVGTVEKIFVPLGGKKQNARVRWHKRNHRGKEFIEIFQVRDLELVPSNRDS
jgi:hypothetical protein